MRVSKTAAARMLGILAVAAIAAAVLLSGLQAEDGWRRIPWKPKKTTSTDDPVVDPREVRQKTIKLMYLHAKWDKVLQDVAAASRTTLVIGPEQKLPPKFSRNDWNYYTPVEAIRILNRELEPVGYRLMFQGQYLVVVNVEQAKQEYVRAEVRPDPTRAETSNAASGAVEHASFNANSRSRASGSSAEIVQVAGFDENPPVANNRNAKPAVEVPKEVIEVTLRHKDAVSVSRLMFDAFKSSAKLIDAGPGGLQGFRVSNEAGKSPAGLAEFSVGIDQAGNRLIVEGEPDAAKAVVKFIEALDQPARDRKSSTKAVATRHNAKQIASILQPQLDAAAEQGRQADAQDQADMPPEEDANTKLPELLGGLKGDVSVEVIPDLGVLLLRGNEKDVEAVLAIIRELEQLTAGTAPDLHLLLLQNVDSVGLAELLSSVYSQLLTARGRSGMTQPVSIFPLRRPNALLIIASATELRTVLELAEKLDQPVDPQSDLKVFRLKYAVAAQVIEMLDEIYNDTAQQQGGNQNQNQNQREALRPSVNYTPDIRTNSIVVQARPRDMADIEEAIKKIDSPESASVAQMRVFPLKFASADDVVETLQIAINSVLTPPRQTTTTGQQQGGLGLGGAQGAGATGTSAPAQVREVRAQVLEFVTQDGDENRMLKSGVLSDIRLSSDPRTNSVVVTAPDISMPLMEQLIRTFDRPPAVTAEIKVFGLVSSDATTMVRLLETLFAPAQQRTGQQGGTAGNLQQQLGLVVAGSEDPSSAVIPLRFTADVRTNAVIASGGAEALRVVEALLLRLDDPEVRQRQSAIIRLKNSPAVDVANAVTQFVQQQRTAETSQEGFLSPFEQLQREVVVQAEPVTNSLLISATPRFFTEIQNFILKIDEMPRQVIIQALLVEVSLDNTDEFGVELGFQDSVLFNRSIPGTPTTITTTTSVPGVGQVQNQQILAIPGSGTSPIGPGFNFNNNPLGNNIARGVNSSLIGPQALSNFSLGRINTDLGYGGLVLAAGSESVNILLRALSARRRVEVLSRPQIRTLDNQLAQIFVGQRIPRTTNATINQQTGFANPQVSDYQAGLSLQVTPRISPDGQVVIEVIAQKGALSAQSVPVFFNPPAATITSPIIEETQARTVVSVPTGQTIVLGGIITNRDENIERKVPLLGDIPLAGSLFRYDFNRNQRAELLIFLTPRVIRNDAESEQIKAIEAGRINFIEELAERIHGPILGAAGEGGLFSPGLNLLPDGTPSPNVWMTDPTVPHSMMSPEMMGPVNPGLGTPSPNAPSTTIPESNPAKKPTLSPISNQGTGRASFGSDEDEDFPVSDGGKVIEQTSATVRDKPKSKRRK